MEFLTVLLSGLIALGSTVGLVVDRTALNAIRSQLVKADQLQVRVDNAPSYQVLQGKVDRVRIAGRGLQMKWQNFRIAAVDVETDPIAVNIRSLRQRKPKLERPVQAGVNLLLTQADLNQALQSPAIKASLRKLAGSLGGLSGQSSGSYDVVNPRVELLENQVRLQAELHQAGAKPLFVKLESGLAVIAGHQLQLVSPSVSIDGNVIPDLFVSSLISDFSQRLDLRRLEGEGITSRVLQLKINPQKLAVVAFVRVEPTARFLTRRSSL